MTDKAAEKKYPGKSSDIKAADLLDLVNEDAAKYIPKWEGVWKLEEDEGFDCRFAL